MICNSSFCLCFFREGSVIVHLLFYVRRASTINMGHIEIFLNTSIPIVLGKQTLGNQYVIKTVSVSGKKAVLFDK